MHMYISDYQTQNPAVFAGKLPQGFYYLKRKIDMDVIKKQRYSSQSSHLQSLGVSSCSPLAMKGLRVSEKERRENTRNQRASTKGFFSCKLQMVQQLHLRASQAYLYVENALFFCYGTNKYTGNKAPDLREPQYI